MQVSGEPSISIIAHHAALKEAEAVWLQSSREQKDMLLKELEEEKVESIKQYEHWDALRKELVEQNAALFKEYEQKATLLQQCQEQMAILSARCEEYERRDASFRGSRGGDRMGIMPIEEFLQWNRTRLEKELELPVGSPPLFHSICFLISV